MPDDVNYVTMKEIKVGRFILIDGIPCRVVEIETSAPGKHGAAKMRITAVGIFDETKRTLLKPSSGDAEVPVISKKKAQVVSISEGTAQLMDLESYETFEVAIPNDLKNNIKSGAEVEVIEYQQNRAIARMVGSA